MDVDASPTSATTTPSQSVSEFAEVKKILWGTQIKDDIFKRWSQGFILSSEEPSALVQLEGGPCAIIAPVQAFILKNIFLEPSLLNDNAWRRLPPQTVDEFLVQALSEILIQADRKFQTPPPPPPSSSSPTSSKLRGPDTHPTPSPQNNFSLVFLNEPLSSRISDSSSASSVEGRREDIFHRNLRVLRLESPAQVQNVIREKLECFKGSYGILQFLYSLILTKGVKELSEEMSEATELIDPLHGHGSQSLINLMLTGRGVNYVWDNEQDVGGLKLVGIVSPVQVGFLTLLERLRYCEVGSYFKNPKFPIWVVGSETHLTVLFSTNMHLVCAETPSEAARRVFHSFDPEGNNFISTVLLEDVLKALDLFSDSEYVEVMKGKLDPESLGIILLNDFLSEFFPPERNGRPETFSLFHYNGLPRPLSPVKYSEGVAVLLETDLRCLSEDNQILTCLQTKWPSIDVNWTSQPSIN